jgi:hypothetical protein
MKNCFLAGVSFLYFVSFTACKKDNGSKGDTKDAQGTFSAVINNKQFIPCVPLLTIGGPIKTNFFIHTLTHPFISVSANNRCDRDYTYGRYIIVSFDSVQIVENATYKLGNAAVAARGQVKCMYSEDLINYDSDSTLPGTITVLKYDILAQTLSASFEATLKDMNSGQTVSLTQGRFDIKY